MSFDEERTIKRNLENYPKHAAAEEELWMGPEYSSFYRFPTNIISFMHYYCVSLYSMYSPADASGMTAGVLTGWMSR